MNALRLLNQTQQRLRAFVYPGRANAGRLPNIRGIVIPTVVLALAILVVLQVTAVGDAAEPDWRWYMTDTHVHTSVSSDAFADMGIHSDAAKALGYDALFVTDHDGGSSFHINRLDANNMVFEDTYTRWEADSYGQLSSSTNRLVSSPVNTGTRSLQLRASASSNKYGETMVWTKRGPNFRSGDIILKFSVYPTRVDANSGLYVSASIGGDPATSKDPTGYTTEQGAISHGKSTVLVWQLGNPRVPSSDPNARVLTYDLGSYTLNEWNHYEINVSDYLSDIPANDRPLNYNALTYLKMAAAANGGTVDGYFDTYSIRSSSPVDPGDEFTHRTSIIDDFNTDSFKAYPGIEMGQQKHTNRLNFGITDPSEYVGYQFGSDGILDTQLSGYPAQLNHPGTTISVDEAIDTLGHGADFLEVREDEWIDAWDEILKQGTQMIGSWSSDTHNGVSGGRAATYMYSPSIEFDDLVHSYFEGRVYNARNNFGGHVLFNLDNHADAPYPARYPVFVPESKANIDVHLDIGGGLSSRYTVNWYRNGDLLTSDSPSGSSYDAAKSISLDGNRTYVRADVRSSSGSARALTQPIFFIDVPDLPSDKQFHIDRIVNPENNGYNVLFTKGVTNSTWSPVDESLSLTLENLPGALVTTHMKTDEAPEFIRLDGETVSASGSLETFDSASDSTWYYDAAADRLYFKARHANETADVRIAFSDFQDTEPPTAPTNLIATAITGDRVDLSWDAATDNIGVTGYDVYRNDEQLATLGNELSYSDTTVTPETEYTYTVVARDGAGNVSAPSDPATITTGPPAVFSDGFELGDMSLWTSSTGIEVQDQDTFTGAFAARATSSGTAAYAYKQLSEGHNELFYRLRFKMNSQGNNSVYLLRHRTGSGGSIMGMFVNSSGRLGYRNDVAGKSTTSSLVVSEDEWHELQVRVKINGDNGETEVWYDGARVDELSKTEAFGTNQIERIQLGENAADRTFDMVFDDVVVNTSFIGDPGGGEEDTEPPTAPENLEALAVSGNQVDLTWSPSTDNVGVTGYDIYRDGQLLTEIGNATSYSDTTVTSLTSYTYQVRARDAAGNVSDPSNEASVTTPEFTVFGDDFETGNMSSWTTSTGIEVQSQDVFAGTYAARATGDGSATYAQVDLSHGYDELFYQLQFKVVSQGSNTVYLLRERTGNNASIMGVYISSTGRLAYRNDVAGMSTTSSLVVSPNDWHELQVRLKIGDTGEIEIWYDGVRIDELSNTENFGTNQIARLQLGENASGRTYDFIYDDVTVDTEFIGDPGSIGDNEPPTTPTDLTATAVSGNQVDLAWSPSTDNIGVDGYDIYRDGGLLIEIDNVTNYSDSSVAPLTSYTYQVRARDAAGNTSELSNEAMVTTPEFTVFGDDFESGDMSLWTSSNDIVVQGEEVFAGSFAARATSTGSATYAQAQLSQGYDELFYRMQFKIVSQGSNTVYLLRDRTANNASIMGVYISSTGRLAYRNDVARQSTTSSLVVSQGEWHELQVRVRIGGESGEIEVWYDGARVDALSKTENFGTNSIARIQLGENASGRTYDVIFDDVTIDETFIQPGP